MRVPWALAAAVLLGTAAGLLLGLSVRTPSPVLVALAAAIASSAVVVPILIGEYAAHEASVRATAARRSENRTRYERHAEQFNRDVYARLRHVAYRRSERAAVAEVTPSGLLLELGDRIEPIATLPNWELALTHLIADPELRAAWETMTRSARAARAERTAASEIVADRLAPRVLETYGLSTKLEGSRLHVPPWCDVPALANAALELDRSGGRRFTQVAPGPDGPAALFYVMRGESPILAVRDRSEADPALLESLVADVASEPEVVRWARGTMAKEDRAAEAVRRFADLARRYSDRVTVEGSFQGTCAVCTAWTPR